MGRESPPGARLDQASVTEAKQIAGVGPTVSEHEGQEQVERAVAPEPGTRSYTHHRGLAQASEPEHAARVHRRTELEKVSSRVRQLRVGRIERIDRGRAREQDEISAAVDRFLICGRHGFARPSDLTHGDQLRAVPTELGRYGGPKQVARFGLQPLGGDDKRFQRPGRQQLDDRSVFSAQALGLLDQSTRNRHRGDLAADHLFALGYGLTVHQGAHRHVSEPVDRVDDLPADAYQAAAPGDEARLALHRWPGFESGDRQRGGQPRGGLILMNITRLQLDDMDLAGLLYTRQVCRSEDASLAKLRPEVVDEYASFYVGLGHGLPVEADRLHVMERIDSNESAPG